MPKLSKRLAPLFAELKRRKVVRISIAYGVFAAAAIPWQMLYFLYSGITFVACWFVYYLPTLLGIGRGERVGQTRL